MGDAYTIRPFLAKDVQPVVDLWNDCLPFDPITGEKLLQLSLTSSYHPDGVFVAEHQGAIIGFLPTIASQAQPPNETGWLLALAIDPAYVSTGVGEDLLNVAIIFLKASGKRIIEVANCQEFSFFPHFDSRYKESIALLEKAGFTRRRELVDITKALTGFPIPQWVLEAEEVLHTKGIHFDYCYESYYPNFLAFIRDNFSERWYHHNRRYVEQHGDPKTKILALRAGEVVGFINFVVTDAIGRIRQTGVLPAVRGQKIGGVLVFKSIAEMQATGATQLTILSCPLEFYCIVEGEITKSYVQLSSIHLT